MSDDENKPTTRALIIERFGHLLGTITDSEVAELANVSQTTISAVRRSLGIPSFGHRRKPLPPETVPRIPYSIIDPFREYVGVLMDVEVAKMANCTAVSVTNYRKRRNIPPPPKTYKR